MRKPTKPHSREARQVRCAIYTRKSTEEGLEQEFNSLDAQRESGEAFVTSQAGEGWTCVPTKYDDGGFSGGTMERPALQRLMRDIEAGQIDLVVCYKVDRLSRSLLDFAKMMQTFEKHRVGFVSVTQQFNTATSMGRLVLNVLLSFAQFEREIISERTRDKIAATRRRGKWSGGRPLLGYDVDRQSLRLVVNEDEARQVRTIFQLYLEHGSLLPVVEELQKRRWTTKQWRTRKNEPSGGVPFDRGNLYRLLTNVVYAGKVKYKDEVHNGEHAAIVEPDVWTRVQERLARNGADGGSAHRNRHGALLKGLLQCAPCHCSMTPSYTTRGPTRYRYYVCSRAQRRGWNACPSKSIPAGEIERFVVDQIRGIGRDPALRDEVLAQVRRQDALQRIELEAEQKAVTRELAQRHGEVHRLVGAIDGSALSAESVERLAHLQESIGRTDECRRQIEDELRALDDAILSDAEITAALQAFDPVWEALRHAEQGEVLERLIQRVDYDGANGKVSIQFRATGLRTFLKGHTPAQGKRQ